MRVAPRSWPVGLADERESCIRDTGQLVFSNSSLVFVIACTTPPSRAVPVARVCCAVLLLTSVADGSSSAHKRALPPPPHAPMHLTVFIIRAHSQPHTICAWRRARRMQHSADGGTRSPAVSAEWIDCVQGPLSAHQGAHQGAHHGAHQTWPRWPTAWTGTTGKAGGW